MVCFATLAAELEREVAYIMATWLDIPDIFWLGHKNNSGECIEFTVQINFLSGKIIENSDFWLLMVKLPTPSEKDVARWITCSGVLLAANGAWQYGIIQRDNIWWLVQRFTNQVELYVLCQKVNEHIAVATLLGRRLQNQLQNVITNDNQFRLSHMVRNGLV
ncbi:hypothetical protein EIN11_22600 [Salmonella enterica]|nr:hypothetical protein [Salmonella enterica]ECC9717546.1 hypothetical protein [Salmonella enterica subsp. diarizonae]EAP5830082.1 hypothetical protein [Salmonella enterica]EAQ9442639.1 hypothetical protein [Salmonella enterica]EAR4765854.1 hypothetical protein [Salmonella enterica]